MAKAKTPKQINAKISSLRKQITGLEKQKKKAVATKKKPKKKAKKTTKKRPTKKRTKKRR